MRRPRRVACLGNLTLDHLIFVPRIPAIDDVALIDRSLHCVGGRGAIVALILGALEVPVSLVTVVGSSMPTESLSFLQNNKVSIKGLHINRRSNSDTAEVFIVVGEREKNTLSFFLPKQ